MSKDVSTQLPNPPELQPISSSRAKIWRSLSLVLTVGGLALIGAGGWVFAQQQIEASKPPPRLVEVSVDDLEATPSPTPSPAPAKPVSTPTTVAAIVEPAANNDQPATSSPTATPTPMPEAPPPTPEPTAEAVSPDSSEADSSAEESALSLADNPLLVVEDQNDTAPPKETIGESSVEESPNSSTEATGSPLARIVAESIDLDSEITEVGWRQVIQNGAAANVWTVADYAAGWHENSALPGQGDNIVLSAHHNIKGEVFRYTVDLEPGDVITLYTGDNQAYAYIVEDKFIVKDKGEPEAVRRENAKWIGPFNEERLTLVTCWPYNNNTHRLIVIAKPIETS